MASHNVAGTGTIRPGGPAASRLSAFFLLVSREPPSNSLRSLFLYSSKQRRKLKWKANVESSSSCFSLKRRNQARTTWGQPGFNLHRPTSKLPLKTATEPGCGGLLVMSPFLM